LEEEMEEIISVLKAYLKAAETSILPGDKYRYYYNVLENEFPYKYPQHFYISLSLAYAKGLWSSYNAFIDTINNIDVKKDRNGREYVLLDEVGSKFKAMVDKLASDSQDLSELEYDSDQIRNIRKIVGGKNIDEKSQLELIIREIPESQILEFLNTEEGKYFRINPKWNNLREIDIEKKDIFQQIANRIYIIRNMVVHSKDADKPRLIPYSPDEKHIEKEIPLIKFIAEWLVNSWSDWVEVPL
jgi:hypothetical protein